MEYIFELLGRKSVSRVLTYFLTYPTEEAYAEQLLKKMKIAKKSLLDALAALLREGLLEMRQTGRVKGYRLRRTDARVRQLKILQSVNNLLPKLKKANEAGMEAYLYGSAARGEDTEKSDYDLLLLGDRLRNDISGDLARHEKIKVLSLTFFEYSEMARKDKPFYERVEKDRIRLV